MIRFGPFTRILLAVYANNSMRIIQKFDIITTPLCGLCGRFIGEYDCNCGTTRESNLPRCGHIIMKGMWRLFWYLHLFHGWRVLQQFSIWKHTFAQSWSCPNAHIWSSPISSSSAVMFTIGQSTPRACCHRLRTLGVT